MATTAPARSIACLASDGVGEVGHGIGTEEDRASRSRHSPRHRECPAASRPPARGRRPSCSAPTMLPRRSAGSTLTSGCTAATTSYTARRVAAAESVDSARLARPATMTTGPMRSWSTTSGSVRAAAAAAAPPDSTRIERQANGDNPVATGDSSISFVFLRTALSRSRRWSTGSSSLRSGPTRITVGAFAVPSMVARGRSRISAGSPSPSWASRCSMPMASARRAQAKASSLVPRAPPNRAIRFARPASIVVRSALATAVSATVQDVSVRRAFSRAPGAQQSARPS